MRAKVGSLVAGGAEGTAPRRPCVYRTGGGERWQRHGEALRRRSKVAVTLAAFLILATGAIVVVVKAFTSHFGVTLTESCRVHDTEGDVSLQPDQAVNATVIAAVGVRRGLPERALTIALATAMQESKLTNLSGGDRDSLGLFQQRPSQGWGTAAQIQDPVYAVGKFYDALVRIPDYASLPLTVAAQQVQHSGAPDAYAKYEGDATTVSAALSGREPAAMSCTFLPADRLAAQTAGASGLTPRAQALRDALRADFGSGLRLRGGQDAGTGRAISALLASAQAKDVRAGWAIAGWAVAHADTLAIDTVIFDGKVWSRAHSAGGWRAYPTGAGTSTQTVANTTPAYADRVFMEVAAGQSGQ